LIPIIGSDIIQLNSKFNEKQFVFEIKTLNKNKIVFGTDDKVEYDDWLRVFNEMKQKYEKKEMKI
jgi:biopolymer transport protein ExbD